MARFPSQLVHILPGYVVCCSRISRTNRVHAGGIGVDGALVSQVGFIPLVGDVADQIGPGDAVGGLHKPGVRDGAEGFADVGRVGDVTVGAEEESAEAGRVGCVAEVCVCGLRGTEGKSGGLDYLFVAF